VERKYLAPCYYGQRAVFASPSAFFIYDVFICINYFQYLQTMREPLEVSFVLDVSALGCPQLKVGDNVWIHQDRTTAKVKCNSTEETWFLACNGREWTGELGNCSSVTAQTGNLTGVPSAH